MLEEQVQERYDRCLNLDSDLEGSNGFEQQEGARLFARMRRSYLVSGLAAVGSIALVASVMASFGEGIAAQGGSNAGKDPHKQVVQVMGLIEYDEETAAKEQPKDPEELASQLKLPKSQCKDNTFYLDWGSSGPKVYLVHAEEGNADAKLLKLRKVKKAGLGPQSAEADKIMFLNALKSRMAPGTTAHGAVLATAGFRLSPEAAADTWKTVRQWNAKEKLFKLCDDSDDEGCHTLSGSKEANYELDSMVGEAKEQYGESSTIPSMEPGIFGTAHFGLASCGGASIQLGISGVSIDDMRQCHKDLQPIDKHYDAKRFETIEKHNLLIFSWLAGATPKINRTGLNDYMVGGIDEMRERYDVWLEIHGHSHNPCIPFAANKYFKKHGRLCNRHSKHEECLSDRFGSYHTSLRGPENASYSSCRESIHQFVHDDLMLERWRNSEACMNAAESVKQWGFISAFGRSAQLGYDVASPTKWSTVKHSIKAKDKEFIQEDEKDMEKGFVGKVLASTMLTTVLDSLGISPDAEVRTSKSEVAESTMTHYGLKPGWIEKC